MGFTKIKIIKRKRRLSKTSNANLKKFIIFSLVGFLGIIILFFGFIYIKVIAQLPNIAELEQIEIPESSIIYDREGNELYTLSGDEKRTYVTYDKISKNIVNSLVAGEDKRYWENPGIDIVGLFRALYYGIIGKNEGFGGTSTLTQQLIRNTIIENRSSTETFFEKIERKIKEIYLAYKLTNGVSKEKILELYLNKISFGSNASGIEQASLTFFGKNAKDLNILEGSIMASIPKGPTYYSPYNHYDRLVGYTYVYPKSDINNAINLVKKADLEKNKDLVSNFKNFINGLQGKRVGNNGILICNIKSEQFKDKMSIDNDGCNLMNYADLLTFLNNIRLEGSENNIEYQVGRKDFILGRMLEDDKITFDDYKKAIVDSVGLEFKPYAEKIKYPHFVFYVKEYLENKYGREILEKEGLKIYTTINPKLQDKAEELVKTQADSNKKSFDANNAALVSVDNKNGDILAMVGSADYFNDDIDGKVNMTTSKRQPGSSFKPFVYALAIDKNPIGPQTPIYDLKMTFPGNYQPNNYNGQFNGKMTIMTALNYSRNIPAIQAYFLAGQYKEIIKFVKKLGIASLDENFYYGAPLALGTGEVKPLEMVQAYSVFANLGNKVELNPILKIYDSKGLLIEEKKQSAGIRVMDEKVAYIMDYILSATESRPSEYWNTNLALNGRQAGAKTGTSNKTFTVNGKKQLLPGDLWTAGFTPQITTVVWVGNTDGKAIKANGDGLNGAAPIWKKFMEFAHSGKEKLTWKQPSDLKFTSTSKISGLLVPEGFDKSFVVSNLFKNIPNKYDDSLKSIQYDAMCNGKVTDKTPPSAIKDGYYVALHSIDPTNPTWEAAVQAWVKNGGTAKLFDGIPNIITDYKDEPCERNENLVNNSNVNIASNIKDSETFINGYNYVEIAYKSTNPLRSLQILLGSNVIQEIDVENQKSGTYKGTINIPSGYYGDYSLTVRAVDSVYLSSEEVRKINIVQKDNVGPEIVLTNPTNGKISVYSDQFFNLRGYVNERSNLKSINIYVDGAPYIIGLTGRDFVAEINRSIPISSGNHKLKIEAVDFYFNKGEKEVDLEIMQR